MIDLEPDLFISQLELVELTRAIWSTFVGVDVWQTTDTGGTVAEDVLTGCIHVSGHWEATVFVEISADHAQRAAEAMFGSPVGALRDEDVSDALGELTNMIAGNVKGALPFPTRLSLPWVARGASYWLRVPGTALRERVLLDSPAGPVRVSIWTPSP